MHTAPRIHEIEKKSFIVSGGAIQCVTVHNSYKSNGIVSRQQIETVYLLWNTIMTDISMSILRTSSPIFPNISLPLPTYFVRS